MADEERYTFSSLMTTLIEIEGKLKQLYQAMAKETGDPKLRSIISDYDRSSSKRMEMMRRARVETIVEIMLEPITGLNLAETMAKMNATFQNGAVGNLQKAIALERTIFELYDMASAKIMQTSADAGELLASLSRQSMERLHQLDEYAK